MPWQVSWCVSRGGISTLCAVRVAPSAVATVSGPSMPTARHHTEPEWGARLRLGPA